MAASKWPPYSPLPFIAPDGTVSEPLSGRFSVICDPVEGEEGIQRAIRDCEEGGSVLLREGAYLVTRTLLLDRSVHIFGRGKAELRGRGAINMILVRPSFSASYCLDQLRIDDQTEGDSYTIFGDCGHLRLRLQGCDVFSRAENSRPSLYASGPCTLADVLGCTFRGGGGTGIFFCEGASGRVEACNIQGYSQSGIALWDAGTSPLISRTTIRDCKWGVDIGSGVDLAWSLGEGVIFTDCAEGDVNDERFRALPPLIIVL